ncbi:MAG: ATP-binding protein [Rhodocyclaceae bacterium]
MNAPLRSEFVVAIAERIEVGLVVVDRAAQVVFWNRFMSLHSRWGTDEAVGRGIYELFPDVPRKWLEKKLMSVFLLKNYAFTSWELRPFLFKMTHNRPITGGIDAMRQDATFIPVVDDAGDIAYVCICLSDRTDTAIAQSRLGLAISELEREKGEQRKLIAKLEEAQSQLLQSEKMAAIGQLAAGVAHEINNPIGFVNSNVSTLSRYVEDLMRLVSTYHAFDAHLAGVEGARETLDKVRKEIDFDFLAEDIEQLFAESRDGLERVKRIVEDLKDFSRVDTAEWQWVDLRQCLDSTLNVVWNEVKYKAEVVKLYEQDLPDVECIPSQLNQVFMNLIVNAAQAIPDRGKIVLRIRSGGGFVYVDISDNGSGISGKDLNRIFDPFFTTKPVGKGTGLGLSVSFNIVRKHGGSIDVKSVEGKGSIFTVKVPVERCAGADCALQPGRP